MFGKLTLGREERGDQLDCPPATEAIRVDGVPSTLIRSRNSWWDRWLSMAGREEEPC